MPHLIKIRTIFFRDPSSIAGEVLQNVREVKFVSYKLKAGADKVLAKMKGEGGGGGGRAQQVLR